MTTAEGRTLLRSEDTDTEIDRLIDCPRQVHQQLGKQKSIPVHGSG